MYSFFCLGTRINGTMEILFCISFFLGTMQQWKIHLVFFPSQQCNNQATRRPTSPAVLLCGVQGDGNSLWRQFLVHVILMATLSNSKAIGQGFLESSSRKRFFTKSHVAAILYHGFSPKTIGHMDLVILMAISNLKAIGQGFF